MINPVLLYFSTILISDHFRRGENCLIADYYSIVISCLFTLGDLSEYARAMEDMDESQELRRDIVRQQEQEEEKKGPPPKPYKHKPYTEIVRVQRPEATRKKPPTKSELAYQGRLQSMSQSEAGTARTETTQREREMIYGEHNMYPNVLKYWDTLK